MRLNSIHVLYICLLTMLVMTACQPDSEPAADGQAEDHAAETGGLDQEVPLGQLPADVNPLAYQLELTIDPREEGFSGRSVIDLEISGDKDHFYIHGQNITANRVELTTDGQTFAADYEQVDKTGIVRISSPQTLTGKVRLSIEYSAPYNPTLEGLYKVSESGNDYAFTQFEAIAARLAFPGFDEPRFKTPFDITLIVPKDLVAISNTPEVSSEIEGDVKVVHFAPTRPLPTYLIAFAVGELDVVEWQPLPATEIRQRPLPLRGVAVKGKGHQLDYALENTNAIVTALESYFGTPYPWAKLDIIAVPDFEAGAMENVGAITYRESLLLFDETATPGRMRRYKMVHAHELAHQWFGNLVTPFWWNDIWLNEAFATWMAHVAMDIAEPDGNFRRDLLSRGLDVMASDSLVNARQIRQPILSNDDIVTAFDGITYSKGGAVLSMFENFLGREDFRQGVRNYMDEFKYGTATADDFVRHLAVASRSHPSDLVIASFNSFLEQPGLPLIEIDSRCEDAGFSVFLKQSRYLPLGSTGDRDQQWQVPVCLRLGGEMESRTTCLVLSEPEERFELPGACPAWLIPNANNAGYYRFAMSQDDWSKLLANSEKQNTNEMMGMLGSLSGAFNAGELDIATLMSIAPQMIASPDWQVATAPIEHMKFMYQRMANEGQKGELESRFEGYYADKLEQTGLEATENRDKAQLQDALVEFLAETAKQPELREELTAMARAYTGFGSDFMIHPQAANPIIIGTALKVAVDELGGEFFDHLRDLALASTDAVVRRRLLTAIGSTRDPVKAAEALELVFSDEVRDNEIYSVLFPQVFMAETRDATWAWFQQNLDRLLERIPENSWGNVAFVGSAFCDREKQAEVKAFFEERIETLTGGPRILAKTLEGMNLCVAKVEYHQAGLNEWIGQ